MIAVILEKAPTMRPQPSLTFKLATEDWELEAIQRLNHETFAEEIPQHPRSADGRLRDKFHDENTYAVCLAGERLVGMVAGRARRPFSLDHKLPALDSQLPAGRTPMEVRLLAVEREFRQGFVFAGLVGLLARHFRDLGCDLALISGTTRQLKLYRHIGFEPFGPLVGREGALFQPMYLTLERFHEVSRPFARHRTPPPRPVANFLPGPVEVREEVHQAFSCGPLSHRSEEFLSAFQSVKELLCRLTRAGFVEILLGSGSLANDAVCAQLSLLGERGLILSNGEFGDRLVDHATRQGLDFDVLRGSAGEPFDPAEVEERLRGGCRPRWLWAVHCETSTGVLNDLAMLQRLTARFAVRLCLDCISSVGTVPMDLSGVHFASCVSGKGLASYPGLSMVFYNRGLPPAPLALPRYLDLGYYAAQNGVPFTHSSNLVLALRSSLEKTAWDEKFERIAAGSRMVRSRLRELGFQVVAPDAHASPAVVTVALPPALHSSRVASRLGQSGFLLSYNSSYLSRLNWVQVCLMGEWRWEKLEELPGALASACGQLRAEGPCARNSRDPPAAGSAPAGFGRSAGRPRTTSLSAC